MQVKHEFGLLRQVSHSGEHCEHTPFTLTNLFILLHTLTHSPVYSINESDDDAQLVQKDFDVGEHDRHFGSQSSHWLVLLLKTVRPKGHWDTHVLS